MSEELKPCPFCGGPATHIGRIDCMVWCENPACDVQGYASDIAAWNTRPLEDALLAELNHLRRERLNLLAFIDYKKTAEELAAKWASVPWAAIRAVAQDGLDDTWNLYVENAAHVAALNAWYDTHAPHDLEPGE